MGDVLHFERSTANVVTTPTSSGVEVRRASFGGGGGGPVEPTVSMREYVDKADEAVELRLNAALGKLPTTATLLGALASAVGIILAILAFGADRFDGGVSASSVIDRVRNEQKITDTAQNAKLDMLDSKLDILLERGARGDAKESSRKR